MPARSRILHLAPFNTSGVPITFVKADRKLGFESRLITLSRDPRGYDEDVCLQLPFLDSLSMRWTKRLVSDPSRLRQDNRRTRPRQMPPVWQPHTVAEKWLIKMREAIWARKIHQVMDELDFWNFDIYQLDGGLEFFRDGRTIAQLERMGKKIICLYTGSDLRTRGLIPAIDEHADLRLTLEFDHLALDPCLTHVFFPFDFDKYEMRNAPAGDPQIVIGHAPTNRQAKGSEAIIAAVRSLMSEFPIRLELIEGLPHAEAIRRKSACDIFIDNLGEFGYGVNAIESLALGICTCTSLIDGFTEQYPDHPFVEITFDNMQSQLRKLCADASARARIGAQGRAWAERHHAAERVVERIHRMLNQDENSVCQ